VIRAELAGLGQGLVVWSWYRIGDHHTANAYEAKLLEIWTKLTFGRQDVARIVLAVDASAGQGAEKTLQSFLSTHLTAIEASLDLVIQDNPP
jgi:EpsI family protein